MKENSGAAPVQAPCSHRLNSSVGSWAQSRLRRFARRRAQRTVWWPAKSVVFAGVPRFCALLSHYINSDEVLTGVGPAHDSTVFGCATARGDGLGQGGGRHHAEQLVQVDELPPVQLIELADGILRIVVAEPPEPIGTLAECELPLDLRTLPGGQLSGSDDLVELKLCLAQ